METNEIPFFQKVSVSMNLKFPFNVVLRFPGDLEYIPAVRKFVSELLQVSGFSQKFAYRSEIIVDEICNNAVTYGCDREDSEVELICSLLQDRIEFTIKDQGGEKIHVEKLQAALKTADVTNAEELKRGLGLEIVRMLSESLDVLIDKNNLTSVHVVRKREDI
jgi:anti-sigma regulatory factor (Ser/Thr protein kinase)